MASSAAASSAASAVAAARAAGQPHSRRGRLQVHLTASAFRTVRKMWDPSVSVGFVPTMGALHEGHLSLVREARKRNDVVVASVFVNPTQFGIGEDFDVYPRQLQRDTDLLDELGVDHLFAPAPGDMYKPDHCTFVVCKGFDDTPEGRARPGHFQGVATVVTKLFNVIRPDDAYFGRKDAAQCALVRRLAMDLDMGVNIVTIDTVREEDGLAMSSRNVRLTGPGERKAACVVYRSLCAAAELYQAGGGREAGGTIVVTSDDLALAVRTVLASEPLVTEVQYVSVDCGETMRPIQGPVPVLHPDREDGGETTTTTTTTVVISVACKIGSVRLIDNIVLGLD